MARELGAKASGAWAAFARTGNPSTKALGVWPEYTLDKRATMILAGRTEVVAAPMDADRLLWERAAA